MSLPAVDTFTGANNDPLSANWTADLGTWTIQSNQADCSDSNFPNRVRWTGDSFNADQYAQAKLGTVANGSGVGVRLSSGGNGYYVRFNAGAGEAYLQRLDTGTETTIQTITGLTIGDLDTWKVEITGTTLKVYQNTVQRGTNTTDATHATGAAGLLTFGNGGALIDDFEANNVGGGGGTRPVKMSGPWGGFAGNSGGFAA